MNDAAQIRRRSNALRANRENKRLFLRRGGPSVPFTDAPPGFRPSVRPSSLRPLPTRDANLKISNREPLRRVRAVNRLRDCRGIDSVRHPSVLLRLKPTPMLCFVRVTFTFNRTLLRLNGPFRTPGNRAPMQIRRKKTAITATSTPPNWFRLETTPTSYFVTVTRNLNEPRFRLEIVKGGKITL